MTPMKKGYAVSVFLAAILLVFSCWWMLSSPDAPGAWINYSAAGLMGIVCSWGFMLSSQYYTDYLYQPVKDIARASESGHGTNIIIGTAIGFKSTVAPILMVSVTVVVSYYLGLHAGIGKGRNAGLFGTAVATMGMLSSAGFVLSMNNYGPIADNAGGIAEMSNQPERVREATDRLDAAGNVTKAMTKVYRIFFFLILFLVVFVLIYSLYLYSRRLDPLIDKPFDTLLFFFFFLCRDIPLVQQHLLASYYLVRSWMSSHSTVALISTR